MNTQLHRLLLFVLAALGTQLLACDFFALHEGEEDGGNSGKLNGVDFGDRGVEPDDAGERESPASRNGDTRASGDGPKGKGEEGCRRRHEENRREDDAFVGR